MNTFRSWNEIYSSGLEFKADILEIQKLATPRERSLQWAQNLRLLTPVEQANPDRDADWTDDEGLTCHRCCDFPYFNSLDPSQPSVTALRLTQPGELRGCDHYIAVSYCWRQPKNNDKSNPDVRSYKVYTNKTGDSRPNKAPNIILDRAIAYASYYGIRFIWIDQECIEQDDRLDQEVGIQSMDIVYERSAAPIGILQTYLTSQWQLDMIGYLDSEKDLDHEQVTQAIELLEQIAGDPWFSRAWILQESTSAGDCIDLLIRYDPSLSLPESFKGLEGELEFQFELLLQLCTFAAKELSRHHLVPASFKDGITEIMSNAWDAVIRNGGNVDETVAFIDQGEALMERLAKVIERILLHTPSDYWNTRIQTHRTACNAALAIMHLNNCFNSKPMDRLAILANLCQYPIRVDTTMAKLRGFPLETSLLVQGVLNGDLSLLIGLKKEVWNDLSPTTDGFSWVPPLVTHLDPKDSEAWIEGIQPFRLRDHHITSDGLDVLGFLWTVDGVVDVSDLQARFSPLFEELSQFSKKEWTKVDEDMAQWPALKDLGRSVHLAQHEGLVVKGQELSRWKFEPLMNKLCSDLIWAILQKILSLHLDTLCDAIWHFLRSKVRFLSSSEWKSVKDAYNAEEGGPATLDEWIEENVDLESRALPESFSEALKLDGDVQDFMFVRTTDPFSGRGGKPVKQIHLWFVERVLEKGCFYYGHLANSTGDGPLATFDVDGPTQVLLPYCEGIEKFGVEWNATLPPMRNKRISWVVDEIRTEDAGIDTASFPDADLKLRNFKSQGMVAGMWKLGDTKPSRYNIS
ncbi:hypothetical protein VTL71DRAFT_2651 [Oculimacula yallundae]|uniref:Heterokaryon incompatibility domain-containing protein n=1 Tax=Oculimacula yallundae TaxID=86028 RepID=A0ABR4C9X7_9HELO